MIIERYNLLDKYRRLNREINEEQAWLAIHELEELSYKELEKYNE